MIPGYYLSLYEFFIGLGVPFQFIQLLVTLTLWLGSFIIAGAAYFIVAKPIGKFVIWFAENKTKTKWDDYIITEKVMNALGVLVFLLLLYRLLPASTLYYPSSLSTVHKICRILNIVAFANLANSIVQSVYDASIRMKVAIHGLAVYRNLLQTIIVCVAILLTISILLNRNIAYIISGLGAMAAVLMLVFRDSILGMVAGIKLTFNKMLKPGDWINVPKYGANGIVRDVRLSTIMVENWDNSIVSVPPYALISDGFQNMQFMKEKGGRRIMRNIFIDAASVRYLDNSEVEEFKNEEWWKTDGKDARHINLTLFRIYLRHLLFSRPDTRRDMLLMVREMEPSPEGIPLQIYLFTSHVDWHDFEMEQADIMDEIIASIKRFGLRLFQHPSGFDLCSAMSVCSNPLPEEASRNNAGHHGASLKIDKT